MTIHRSLPVLLATLLACQGKIGDRGEVSDGQPTPAEEFEPAFTTQDTQPQLLPFWVRMERVAAVVERPLDDPMFEELKANRLGLGDYDYASGVKPDRMWSPARMTLWAKSLRPVCASEAMHALYPDLATEPDQVVALASAAWGRPVTMEELSFEAPSLASLPQANRYEVLCLSVLSSAELVIQ